MNKQFPLLRRFFMRRPLLSMLVLSMLSFALATAALANCDKALSNNRREALAQLQAFQTRDIAAKRALVKADSETLMHAVTSDPDESDFRPAASCSGDATMYYNLANILSGLNLYSISGMREQALPVGLLEPYIGHAELTLDLFKEILRADINIYRASHAPVPADTQALAVKYLPNQQP
jgi:hypothetical protein